MAAIERRRCYAAVITLDLLVFGAHSAASTRSTPHRLFFPLCLLINHAR
jgi:hypothetical protein